jgi:hypothetical protein
MGAGSCPLHFRRVAADIVVFSGRPGFAAPHEYLDVLFLPDSADIGDCGASFRSGAPVPSSSKAWRTCWATRARGLATQVTTAQQNQNVTVIRF